MHLEQGPPKPNRLRTNLLNLFRRLGSSKVKSKESVNNIYIYSIV